MSVQHYYIKVVADSCLIYTPSPLVDHCSMCTLSEVLKSLECLPVLGSISFHDLLRFVQFACMAKPAIKQHTLDICHPPEDLPGPVEKLLAGVLTLSMDVIHSFWALLRQVVWHANAVVPSADDVKQYNRHGEAQGIGKSDINSSL